MPYKYASKATEKSARAVGLNLPISTKYSVEISRMIRGKSVAKAIVILEKVSTMERAVPMLRFHNEVPHKKGMSAGKYPWKAAKYILAILKSAESNASDKGLLSDGLIVKSIVPQGASDPMHYGRKGRRRMKRTHIEIVVEESIVAKEKKSKAAPEVKVEKKTEEKKPAEKKTEEHKPIEKKAEEPKPAEKKTLETKPADEKSAEESAKSATQKVNKASTKQKKEK